MTHQELKGAQQRLVQSEKLASIGQLATGIAHEINNPLGFISSNISTLDKYIHRYSTMIKALEHIVVAVEEQNLEKAREIRDQIRKLQDKLDLEYISRDVDHLLRESQEGVTKIKNIVKDLKTFSHRDDETRNLNYLNVILEGVLNIAASEIKDRATICKEYGQIQEVACNSQQIGQVFMNIVMNAAQAIESTGTITVRTYCKGNFAPVW